MCLYIREHRQIAASQEMVKNLSEEMDESLIPQAYGGPNAAPLYESKHEIELRELVKRLNISDSGAANAHASPAMQNGLQANGS